MRMLYRTEQEVKSYHEHMNMGLWYDKFADKWSEPAALKTKSSGEESKFKKAEWIGTVAGKSSGESVQLDETIQRRNRLFAGRGGTPTYFVTSGPFVTGLGRDHPVENGFAWHHTLGTAYLPGSSVKGLVRDWAEQWSDSSPTSDDRLRIFGSADKTDSRQRQVGSVIFCDALPIKPVKLKADVMTPHYGDYYQNEAVPGDWLSPVPIPFLVVDQNQAFQFGVLPRRLDNPQDKSDCELTATWLEEALSYIGAGAKTAVGYGRFVKDQAIADRFARLQVAEQKQREEEQQKLDALQAVANKSELAKQFLRHALDNKWQDNKVAFEKPDAIEGWLTKIEQARDKDALEHLLELMEQHFTGLLADPEKTKGKKANPVYSDRQRKIAHRVLKLRDELMS
jgi:CRISPR-associated protein Cmr6